jgi:lipopolysaccharide/colanic/teichoic acid biosynthesis glycosyltransferase
MPEWIPMPDIEVTDHAGPHGGALNVLGRSSVDGFAYTAVASRTAAEPAPGLRVDAATSTAAAAARRALDVFVAAVVLTCLAPLLLIVALLIKLDSPGSVLFRQRRLGKDMRPFTVLKFRTMRTDSSPEIHSRYIAELARATEAGEESELKKLTDDPRITRLGRILRKLSIDEIPQLANVIAGQMALVGPRPALEYELQHYRATHFLRFAVRPGITGLWQVSGRNRLGFNEMLDLDAEYATTATFSTNVRILARTPIAAVRDAG